MHAHVAEHEFGAQQAHFKVRHVAEAGQEQGLPDVREHEADSGFRLGQGFHVHFAADFMQRLEEGRRRHDDALRLLRKLDIAAHGIMDHGKWRRTRRRRRLLRPTAAREHGERQKAHECA